MNTTFDNDITINQMQLAYLDRIAADLPADQHYASAAGHGHSPAWVLGHLAIVGEMGCMLLGGDATHREWIPVFGPGSSGKVEPDDAYTQESFLAAINTAYPKMHTLAAAADEELLARPHGVELLEDTPVKTVSQIATLILTNHFAFHLSQLSSCRRAAGHAALF